ncbi:MAG: class D sortase [Candidatus Yanofskybacteria bacterium]|nr:class D sortase [Candidatus Yanofskybacteria bacterium]
MTKISFKIEKLYSKVNKFYKKIGLVLICIGIAGITFPFWGATFWPRSDELSALEQLGALEDQAIPPTLLPLEGATPTPGVLANRPTYNNKLIMESAGIEMPIFASNNDKVLLKGGWMFSGNSRPDLGGNTVIFGHRWLYRPPVKNTFFNLDKVKVGDRFTIDWNGKTFTYETSEIKIVNPTDVWIMNPTDTPQVTLITCTPLFSTKQRLVVVGRLI